MDPSIHMITRQIKTSPRWLFIQIVLIFFIPIAAVEFGLVSLRLHVLFLVTAAIGLLIMLRYNGWTLAMLGFKKRISRDYLWAYAIFTTAGLFIITQTGELVGNEELSRWWTHGHFLYAFLVVSVFQEIAYRGYLIPVLAKLERSPMVIAFCNALFFTLLHAIFPSFAYNLPLAFVGGLGFACMYLRYPNLTLIILSHAVLNFAAVLYGFFIVPGITY